MKNQKVIAQAWAQFNSGDLIACQSTLDRINRNFALESDEFTLQLDAKLYQPLKDIAEKLIEDGKPNLIGDTEYIATKAYLKYDLKIQIHFKAVDHYDYDDADEDMEIEPAFYYCSGHVRFDNEGIAAISANGGEKAKHWHKAIKKLVERWLKEELGKVKEWL